MSECTSRAVECTICVILKKDPDESAESSGARAVQFTDDARLGAPVAVQVGRDPVLAFATFTELTRGDRPIGSG